MGEIIVGIDIGTTKVCTVIGRASREKELEILGKGSALNHGVKKGIIVDIDSTSSAIRDSVLQAEASANLKVKSAYVNIIGTHVNVIHNRGMVLVSDEDKEITYKDVEKVLHSARSVDINEDMQIIDVIPKQYIIDGYDGIADPVGMAGIKLEADVDIVAAKITSVQNIVKSMERAGLKINGIVVEAMAVGDIALTPDEKEMGIILIDVGGGITDISFIKNNKMLFYDSIPVGGDHITNDVSIGLKIQYQEAEKLKREYQLALTSLIKNDQDVQVVDSNDNKKKAIKISQLVEIIEARVYEIFWLSKAAMEKAGINPVNATEIVLIGGGISCMDGAVQLASEVYGIPVRISSARVEGILKSDYITAAGIIRHISNNRRFGSSGSDVAVPVNKNTAKKESGLKKIISKIFNDLF